MKPANALKERKQMNSNTTLLVITIVLFFVLYAAGCVAYASKGFTTVQTFLNVFRSNAGLICVACGMTCVMLTGGIDISVGSLVALDCMLLAYGGVLVITSGAGGVLGEPDPFGLCCVIASTLLYALFWIVNTRCALPALPGFAICFGVAFLLALVVLLVQGAALLVPLRAALGGIYVGLFELSIPFVLWGHALSLTSSVARLSTLPFLVPFFCAL